MHLLFEKDTVQHMRSLSQLHLRSQKTTVHWKTFMH